ncbi:MAG: polysaccharide pyruvyl transferase family protein [Deltaproteobacteria bacterium]|nr:polysaccharide pyruvyl transferase family protein [Deltaproteobacteria bacterium]
MERIRQFLTDWVTQTGVPVVLCPEVRYEIPLMHDNVYQRLAPKVREKCIWMDQFWTTEQAYSLYRQAEMVVSMEMHSVIMALSLGTPVLMPQFSENGRKVWMLEELDLRDWIFDIDDPADAPRLLAAALRIHQDPAQAEARIRRQLPPRPPTGPGNGHRNHAVLRPPQLVADRTADSAHECPWEIQPFG